ncbi:MAG: hypothetical protein ACI9KE_005409 [Polyangiales bacterium]|jgi:hypothetical protein
MSARYSLPGAITFDAYLRDADLGGGDDASDSRDLHLLSTGSLSIAHGWVVLAADVAESDSLLSVIASAGENKRIHVRLLDTRAPSLDLSPDDIASGKAGALVDTWKSAWPETINGQAVLIAPTDAAPGRATSSNIAEGKADEVCVWGGGAHTCWRIDRRSTRVSENGEGIDMFVAESVADLVDRVQLALGRPVEVEWALQDERPTLIAVRDLAVPNRVAGPSTGPWRRVSLALDDEGTVVPLAIDTLGRALRAPSDSMTTAVVERVFARPYRRRAPASAPTWGGERKAENLRSAGLGVARASSETASFFADMRRFDRSFSRRLEERACALEGLGSDALAAHLSFWQDFAGEPLLLLNRARRNNRALLAALESVVGALDQDVGVALSMPRFTSRRQSVHTQLAALKAAAGGRAPADLDVSARNAWKMARSELSDVRALGIDLSPVAFGATNGTLSKAVGRGFEEYGDQRESRRHGAEKHVRSLASGGALGAPRLAIAGSVLLLLRQLTRAKGLLAEQLATALLGVRRVALEAGRRLEEEAILDEPLDALYLSAKEIRKSLGGNVAGYAARVRARREDDRRWANFAAPRRLGE